MMKVLLLFFWILYDCHSYAYERHVFFFFETPHHLMYRDRFLHFCIICLLQCVEKKKVYNYIWIYFCKRLYLLANMLHQLSKEEELSESFRQKMFLVYFTIDPDAGVTFTLRYCMCAFCLSLLIK